MIQESKKKKKHNKAKTNCKFVPMCTRKPLNDEAASDAGKQPAVRQKHTPPPFPLPTVQCCGGQSAQQKVQAEIVHRVHISDAYTPKTGQRVGVRRGNGIRNSLPSLERPKILVSLSLHLPLSIYLSFYNHTKYGAFICGICGL